MKLSVIVPAYNEGSAVTIAYDAITSVVNGALPNLHYEILFIDDGSGDDTFEHLNEIARSDVRVKVVRLSQNCGAHMAIRAGLDFATGDAACFVPCDLQEPPELIPRLLGAMGGPIQIVWAVRDGKRQDTSATKLMSWLFFAVARVVVSKNVAPRGASMFMLGPEAIKTARLHREQNLTLDGLLATMSFPQAQIPYERQARQTGESKWTLSKRLKLFADFFVGYSYTPIRMMSYLGMITASLSFLYGAVVFVNRVYFGHPIEGWTSLMLVLLFVSGVQMIMLGVIGEYVWRTLDEARARPRYVVRDLLNVSVPDSGTSAMAQRNG